MRKLSAKWAPKCLNVDQICQQCQWSEQLLEFFQRDLNNFLSWLVTTVETWLYHYDLESKQQSMEWPHSSSPRPKKFRVQKSAVKVLPSIFWDQDSILLTDYLPKGQTINMEYYSSLLLQLKDILKEKCHGKVTKGVLFLRDNAWLTGHLQPKRNWPTWASIALITHPVLRIWPCRTITCSLDWKNNWKVAFFIQCGGHCCCGDPVGQTTFWIFFEWLAKVRATG